MELWRSVDTAGHKVITGGEQMGVVNLVEKYVGAGNYLAVWRDEEADVIILQYKFLHLILSPEEFSSFAELLGRAAEELVEITE